MPEFLQSAFSSDQDVRAADAAIRLVAAVAFGCAVAFVYRWTRGRSADRRFVATLVLLTLLLSVTTIVIGNNVARAFSIVGALSIVRFRTVVEDTRDTAFVICAVALGLAVGAGYLAVPAMALPFIAIAAKFFSGDPNVLDDIDPSPFTLHVKVAPDFARRDELQRELGKCVPPPNLIGIESARAGTAVERSYGIELAGERAADELIDRLSRIEGVLAVEVVRAGK
jgi:hypothetical protein